MEGFRHICPITVRFRDLDVFGHVNNAVVFTFLETARVQYLIDLDIYHPEENWLRMSVILAHINCDFRKPIRYGQIVEIGTRVTEIRNASFKLEHRLEADGELAAEGYGIVVYYNYAAHRSEPIPSDMRTRIEAYENLTS